MSEAVEDLINRTDFRKDGFNLMVEHLRTIENPLVVETGCAREEGSWTGDGMSTRIFDSYVTINGGVFHSVDISEDNVAVSKRITGEKSQIHCSDSVAWLEEFNKAGRKIDLLYLDSFDLDKENPQPSMEHHMKEYHAIKDCIGPGTMLAIDDNFSDKGKGFLVRDFLKEQGIEPIHNGYQLIWKF
jgi:hypothetical protein